MLVEEIAQLVDGTVVGEALREIHAVRKIEEAHEGDLSFIANPKYSRFHETTSATALLVDEEFATTRGDVSYIVVDDPYAAFLVMLRRFAPPAERPTAGVHATAVISESAQLGSGVSIGPNVVIGDRTIVADNVVIAANSVVDRDVAIGNDAYIHANVTLHSGTVIGRGTVIHSGVVIGADGFGFAPREDGSWEKVPQTGIVVVGDDVEIGANSTIDRATLGVTAIGNGVKIDNLVHIAHNVTVGANTVIAAQTGISGSTHIGGNNMIAGQVGIVGHVETADIVIIEAQSGVSKSIRKAGRYFGHPAKEHALALRQEGALRQLPDLLQEIREMRNRLQHLESLDSPSTGDE